MNTVIDNGVEAALLNKRQISPVQAIEMIEKAASRPNTQVRDGSKVAVGQVVRQGDIYLMRLDNTHDTNGELVKTRQLVDGTTMGSRHIVEGDAVLTKVGVAPAELSSVVPQMFCAYISVGSKGATLSHPEHAHVTMPKDSVWAAWSQIDPATMARVKD